MDYQKIYQLQSQEKGREDVLAQTQFKPYQFLSCTSANRCLDKLEILGSFFNVQQLKTNLSVLYNDSYRVIFKILFPLLIMMFLEGGLYISIMYGKNHKSLPLQQSPLLTFQEVICATGLLGSFIIVFAQRRFKHQMKDLIQTLNRTRYFKLGYILILDRYGYLALENSKNAVSFNPDHKNSMETHNYAIKQDNYKKIVQTPYVLQKQLKELYAFG